MHASGKSIILFIAHLGNFYGISKFFLPLNLYIPLTILGRTVSPQTRAQKTADLA